MAVTTGFFMPGVGSAPPREPWSSPPCSSFWDSKFFLRPSISICNPFHESRSAAARCLNILLRIECLEEICQASNKFNVVAHFFRFQHLPDQLQGPYYFPDGSTLLMAINNSRMFYFLVMQAKKIWIVRKYDSS